MSDTENGGADIRRSSRRRENTKVTSRLSAIEAMKEARKSGKGYRPNVEVNDVYEMVDEDEYQRISEQRRESNFVVDDDGNGYVDNGDDDFGDEYDVEYDEDLPSKKKDKNGKRDKKEKKKGRLDNFFSVNVTKSTAKDESTVKLDDDDELKDMLGDILDGDDEPIVAPAPSASRNPFKRERTTSPSSAAMMPRPIAKRSKTSVTRSVVSSENFTKSADTVNKNDVVRRGMKMPEKNEMEDDFDYGIPAHDEDPVKIEVQSPESEKPLSKIEDKKSEVKIEPMEENEELETSLEDEKLKKSELILSSELWDSVVYNKEDEDERVDVNTATESFYVIGGPQKDTKAIRMYWLDAFEDTHKNTGTVYLFGRVLKNASQWASCCVVVKNIMRQVFFLPRESKQCEPDEPVKELDVFGEIKHVFKRNFNTNNFKCRPIEKRLMKDKELGNSAGETTRVMEVQYESIYGKLAADTVGSTFSRVFNTTTSPLERLLIEKRFMGPGWIEIYNFNESTAKQTNCDFEFNVDMERMKNIEYVGTQAGTSLPTVRMTAINVLTTLNEKKENEVCMISMLYNPKSSLVHPSAETKDLRRLCLVTKPVGGALPFDIKKRLEVDKMDDTVTCVPNEKALLTLFLARINEMEPDVIVGHDLSATTSVLVSRLEKLKVANWSRISRLKRTISIGKVGHSRSGQWELTAGRLLLDSRLAAMELVKSRSFDLSELSSLLLKVQRQNIYVNDIVPMYSSSEKLMSLIRWSFSDPLLALRIVVQLNALPLFTQITNIVGGVASRTLMGGRAERNEFLLMHAFNKADLIAPDKHNPFAKKGRKAANDATKMQDEDGDGDGDLKTSNGKSKAQYSGGLVLEPKKGLYDTLILLLDFNSLYPSIIQEYNICFTTVLHTKDSDDLPEVPQTGLNEGVLPREIRKLVECRREVKALMKTEKKDGERRQLDIRQTALKLTANSMYGCLGFQYSRFYAKPLAALVTAKGREILMHSKDLVEKLGYSVIYGDTDSIMINTNSVDLALAKKLGFEIKKQVNKCHRLLELDLDGVFKRMLLLKKKKYAALTIDPDTKAESKELKGLDIVRRDWSQLAKETGTDVVDRILDASLSRDELVASIEDLLRQFRAKLDSGKVSIDKFQICKQLTRNPRDYADVKSQPHAAVARRLNESGKFSLRQGDIVEYIVCEDGSTNAATQRAYHRVEMEDNKELKIDVHYYLAQQVHPVVSRLCAPIEEADVVRIAEALGMDSSNYRRAAAAHAAQVAEEDDQYAWQPENYELCEGIVIKCPNKSCGATSIIRSAFDCETQRDDPRPTLAGCDKCDARWYRVSFCDAIVNSVDRQMAGFIEKHASAAYQCDDPTCDYATRTQTLKWCREGLECPSCSTGILRKQYTSRQLFEQQMFFRSILDVKDAVEKLSGEQMRAVKAKRTYDVARTLYDEILEVVDEYLQRNAYNRVDLAYIFAPMLKLD